MQKPLLGIIVLLLAYSAAAQKTKVAPLSFPLTEQYWSPKTENVRFMDYKNTKAVRSTDENPFEIVLKDFDFAKGTIEFDVELRGRGFPGIRFHLNEETGDAETFYLRYFGQLNPLSRNTMQYAAIIDGVNLWDLTDEYQAASVLYENEWNHVKLVIANNQMKAYVNDMDRAALHVPMLEGLTKTGKLSLNGDIIYANFKVFPDKVEDLGNAIGYNPTCNDPNYLRNWQVMDAVDFPTGKDVMRQKEGDLRVIIDSTYFKASGSWNPISAKYRGIINLTEKFGSTEDGSRRLSWLKTTVTSEKGQEKLLKLGFNDEVWVFINGQHLYQGKNYYGSPGMKEPKGRCALDNTAFEVPLKKGENKILIGLANYFFGWGLIARWEDTDGLRY